MTNRQLAEEPYRKIDKRAVGNKVPDVLAAIRAQQADAGAYPVHAVMEGLNILAQAAAALIQTTFPEDNNSALGEYFVTAFNIAYHEQTQRRKAH